VSTVRVGKAIRFRLDAADEGAACTEVEQLCSLPTNPVIEDAVVSMEPG
jgi:phosphoribosylformylglycinamidine synthase